MIESWDFKISEAFVSNILINSLVFAWIISTADFTETITLSRSNINAYESTITDYARERNKFVFELSIDYSLTSILFSTYFTFCKLSSILFLGSVFIYCTISAWIGICFIYGAGWFSSEELLAIKSPSSLFSIDLKSILKC